MSTLPALTLADFDPGSDHVVRTFHGDRVLAILHKDDPALGPGYLAEFRPTDGYHYVFVHGGDEDVPRFQNTRTGATHEVPVALVVQILQATYGAGLSSLKLRMATCYGHVARPGYPVTAIEALALGLPGTHLEGYDGLVSLVVATRVASGLASVRLGPRATFDPTQPLSPFVTEPTLPKVWERVQ